MKKCTLCQKVKPDNEFQIHSGGNLGPRCKVCVAEQQRKWYESNKAQIQLRRNTTRISRRVNELLAEAKELGIEAHLEYEGEFKIVLEK